MKRLLVTKGELARLVKQGQWFEGQRVAAPNGWIGYRRVCRIKKCGNGYEIVSKENPEAARNLPDSLRGKES